MTAMTHLQMLQRLLQPSSFDPAAPRLRLELQVEGDALDAALGSNAHLLLEMDPRTCSATMPDWERVFGLPEDCVCQSGITQTTAERRAALVAKESMVGGQTPAFFVQLAATLGYSVSIAELRPHTTQDTTQDSVRGDEYRHVWQVTSPLYSVRESTTQDDTQMPTMVWGNTLLECTINRYKPAHTLVLFAYV